MIPKKLLSVAGVCALTAISGVAFLTPMPQSDAQTLQRAPASPRVIVKHCGKNFSKSGSGQSYQCTMVVDHYCPSGLVKSAMVISGNQLQYSCTKPPA